MSVDFVQGDFSFGPPEKAVPGRRPRTFLGWHRPLVELASRWLWEVGKNEPEAQPVDLSNTLVIVPTRGAARGLRRSLLAVAQKEGAAGLLTPQIRTPSYLLDLGVNEATVASDTHRLVAWVEVFIGMETSAYSHLFPRDFKATGFRWALQMGQDLITLQEALGEGGFSIAAAADRVSETKNADVRRWQELATVEGLYRERLERMGMLDPVEARREAHILAAESLPWKRVVLMGVADPPRGVDALLHGLASAAGIDVEVVVGAPESMADDFDLWGRPLPDKWGIGGRPLPLDMGQIHLLADPSAEAKLVARRLEAGSTSSVDEVAVGLADPAVSQPIARELEASGIAVFDPDGSCLMEAPMWGFLEGLGELLAGDTSFDAVQRIARHPAISGFLPEGASLPEVLVALDEVEARRLPASLASAIRGLAAPGRREADRDRVAALEFLRNLATGLARFAEEPIDVALDGILAQLRVGEGEQSSSGCSFSDKARRLDRDLVTMLRERARIVTEGFSAGSSRSMKALASADGYALLLSGLATQRSYGAARSGEVQLHGWLDLLWSDAPQVVLTGANEGMLPVSVVGDVFLPDSLRRELGLRDNEARLSRDRFLLEMLLRSRAGGGRVDIALAKTDSTGNPLKPSRLLFACSDKELPARVRMLFGGPLQVASPIDERIDSGEGGSAVPAWSKTWSLRLPYDSKEVASRVEKVSATMLRDYLACPFIFYLKQVLKMEQVNSGLREMDPLAFGNLCHEAFEMFARDEKLRYSEDAEEIADFLVAEAERRAGMLFGDELPVPVRVQMESVRQRLVRAARVQAEERAAGWIIEAAELRLPGTRGGPARDGVEAGEPFLLGGVPLTGIIDRVDRHEVTGEVRVVDYKTSAVETSPFAAHLTTSKAAPEEAGDWKILELAVAGKLKRHRWTNLQLPLYAAYIGEHDPFGWKVSDGDIKVGYFNLPLAVTQTAIEVWPNFGNGIVRSALSCAAGVVERMRQGVFWPPELQADKMYDFGRLFPREVAEVVDPAALPGLAETSHE